MVFVGASLADNGVVYAAYRCCLPNCPVAEHWIADLVTAQPVLLVRDPPKLHSWWVRVTRGLSAFALLAKVAEIVSAIGRKIR